MLAIWKTAVHPKKMMPLVKTREVKIFTKGEILIYCFQSKFEQLSVGKSVHADTYRDTRVLSSVPPTAKLNLF